MRIIKKLLINREYRTLSQNILNLFLFQGTNYLLPLITIPYIVRVIGPEKFGILSFAEAVNYYFVLITDYGFNITGTQKISIFRDNPFLRNEIFTNVIIIKLFLMIVCFLILIILMISGIIINPLIYFFYFSMVPANILLSYWFYIGVEKMHYLNYPNTISKVLFAMLIFLFLKNTDQFYFVPMFYGLSLLFSGILSLIILVKKFNISLVKISLQDVLSYMKNGWSIFVSIFAINLYRKSNVLLLGLVATRTEVGFYSAGEKLIVAVQSIFNPVVQAFFPFISRKKITHLN